MLMNQAFRPEPITHGLGVLGRLAALGVGQHKQDGFEQQVAESRLKFAAGLAGAGDNNARIAVITSGLNSPDPETRKIAGTQLAAMTEQKFTTFGTPGGGTAGMSTVGGVPQGAPRQLVQGRAATPNMYKVESGEEILTLMSDPETGAINLVGRAPRGTRDRGMTPDAAQQRKDISAAGASSVNVMNPTGPGAAIASVDMLVQSGQLSPEIGAQIKDGMIAQAAQTPAAAAALTVDTASQTKANVTSKLQGEALRQVDALESFLQASGGLDAMSPGARAAYDQIAGFAANSIAKARGTPGAEPGAADIERARNSLPGMGGKAMGVDSGPVFSALRAALNAPPSAAGAQPAAKGGMSAAQLRRMADLLEKAGQ